MGEIQVELDLRSYMPWHDQDESQSNHTHFHSSLLTLQEHHLNLNRKKDILFS